MWPKEYVDFQRIEELLQCGICYEYMNTSVITKCSHNYCSLCIRKYLYYKTQCPVCSENTFEKDLQKNKVLDDIIIHFVNVKKKLEKIVYHEGLLQVTVQNTNSELMCSPNNSEYNEIESIEDTSETLPKNSDSLVHMANNTTPCKQKDYQPNVSTPSTSTERKISSFFTPKSRKALRNDESYNIVTCPVCKVNMSERNINKHLDDCLKRDSTKAQTQKNEPKLKSLPKLVFCLMKDSEIRKKLKQFGLSTQGDRRMLEKRLNKYTIYYNAERDKDNPRPVSEIIKQLEEEENTEKKVQVSSNRLNITRHTEHNIIEQQRKKYLGENKDSFDKLIAKIKQSSKKLPVRNILNKENSNIPHKDNITETNSSTDNSMDPMDLVTTELSSFSNSTNPEFSNHKISNRSSSLETSNAKMENSETEELLFFKRAEMHEEVNCTNQSRDYNILKDEREIDSNVEKLICGFTGIESEYKKEVTLSMQKSRNDSKYSPEKRVTNLEHTDEEQKDLSNKGLYEDVCTTEDNASDIQDDYNNSIKQNQLCNVKMSNCTKSEKENLESRDENVKTCALRKRNREVTPVLSDEEEYGNRSSAKKPSRLCSKLDLSEPRRFNNETFVWNEEKLQNQQDQSRVTRAKSRSTFAKSVRLKNKIS